MKWRIKAGLAWLGNRPWIPIGALLVTIGFALRAAFPSTGLVAVSWWILVGLGASLALAGFLVAERDEQRERKIRQRWEAASQGTVATGRMPAFPEELKDWSLTKSWVATVRVFSHTNWMPAPGPEEMDRRFPATQNGASLQLFLIRWRCLAPQLEVEAGQLNAAGAVERTVRARAGWMVLDGSHTPAFKFVPHGGLGTLYDLAVEVQRWQPSA